MPELVASLTLFAPEIALTLGLLAVVLVDSVGGRFRDASTRILTLATLLAALALSPSVAGPTREIWSGMLAIDPLGVFFKMLVIGAALVILLAFTFKNSRELWGLGQGEFYALLLAVTLANALLASANDLVMLYLSLEMVSIGSYVMVAYMKGDRLSNEASLKYVLFGAVSTGSMLYGLSLLYGLTGTTSLPGVRAALEAGLGSDARFALYIIGLLVFAGFGFKTAAVPFHFWCPDVYQGAPTPVTAFLSVAPKAAGFAVMLRFFFGSMAFEGAEPWALAPAVDWPQVLMLLSVLTMTVGNVAALTQTNMKRLLAYSSIAHAGYLLMGIVALSGAGARGLMIYLLAYLFMNLGAFLVVTLVHRHDDTFDLRDYPGLWQRAPFLTLAMGIFLLSLIGIPPLVGFLGKLYLFYAIIEKGSSYYWYVVVGAVNVAIGAFYYLRVMKTMVVDEAQTPRPALVLPLGDRVSLLLLVGANLLPILFWGLIDGWARGAAVLYAGR